MKWRSLYNELSVCHGRYTKVWKFLDNIIRFPGFEALFCDVSYHHYSFLSAPIEGKMMALKSSQIAHLPSDLDILRRLTDRQEVS